MRNRDHLIYGLILGIIVCCSAALTTLDYVASAESAETGQNPFSSWPHHHPPVVARHPVSGHEDLGSQPVFTTVTSAISVAVAAEATHSPFPTTAPTAVGPCRCNNSLLATISSLSGALEEANSNAIYFSSLLATSIIGLQESIDRLTSSASSALASVQASASIAIASTEESASNAVIAAERSAASTVSSMSEKLGQGTVTVTATVVSVTTDLVGPTITADPNSTMAPNNPQALNSPDIKAVQGAASSVNRAAIAVVVAIIGSSVLSLAGFYLFVRYRKRKQKQKEEDQNVSDALDRAIVSYIVNDQASPTKSGDPFSPTGPPGPIHLETIQEAHTPSPTQGPQPPPVRRPSQAYLPSPTPWTPQFEPSADMSQGKMGQAVGRKYSTSSDIFLPSPGPPPTIPLPTPPTTQDIRRNISTRYAPECSKSVYGDILARPLETVPTNTSVMSGTSGGGHPLGHSRTASATSARNNSIDERMASNASASARGKHARGPSTTTSRRRAASTGSVRSQGQGMGDQQQWLQKQQLLQPGRRDDSRDPSWPLPKNGLI
ncbi:uncharacterized protein B0T23DRAFT_244996 [Neurospora hispaniola]|uniref:Mid2 domain-containing protein n=1 Tax=Neurospora hispaniola TaxID=588809 RepID=A0AAJ0HZS8_9PEZI|nr:hypothetical protein B0T23DRAFT_244996 [Neurospora hispaniola]